ncbi:hypothetical protein HN587_00195 [Candidatus Woesearchaeota archaeon]|jgi:hypothetical protein|nr:hypothetical protein [Candidatus Woesearchaeota archaeon]
MTKKYGTGSKYGGTSNKKPDYLRVVKGGKGDCALHVKPLTAQDLGDNYQRVLKRDETKSHGASDKKKSV